MKDVKLILRLGVLLGLVAVLSGCSMFGSIEWEWKGPRNDVRGYVKLYELGAPMTDARVFFNGPINRSTTSRRSGAYSITLPNGTYDVTVSTLHHDYTRRVTILNDQVLDLVLPAPGWFDRELFYWLSGIRQIDADGRARDIGEMARWEQSKVRIFFDTLNAPWGVPATTWANQYFAHIRGTWRDLLKDSIIFEQVYSGTYADVVVAWVPAGSLDVGPDYRRVATKSAYYWSDGSLERVRIWIDEEFATVPGIWEHEWAQAMGIGYSNDPKSLMYPELRSNQRTYFSTSEIRHIRLIYDLPSGLTKSHVWSMSADEGAEDEDAEGQLPALVEAASSGYAGHIRTVDGSVIPLDPFEAAEAVLGW